VAAQFDDPDILANSQELITSFVQRRQSGDLATDQLLNAIFMATSASTLKDEAKLNLSDALLRSLSGTG